MAGVFDISDNRRTVEALIAGDEAVFEAVYEACCARLKRYAAAILQDEEAASEVVQELFVSLWLRRRRLDPAKPLANYLLRAVHNNALRLRKYDEARRRREREACERIRDVRGHDVPAPVYLEQLALAVEQLPERSRRVLVMSYWENKRHAVIASELSISVRTVETILYKVMKKLRGEIKKK